MQTSVIEPIAAASTPPRSTRDAKSDGGFEDVLGALLEPARNADLDAPARRDSRPAEPPRDRQRPEAAEKADKPDAAAEAVDSEVRDPAAATHAEAKPEPDTSAASSPDNADEAADEPEAADRTPIAAPAEPPTAAVASVLAKVVTTDIVMAPATILATPVVATTAASPDTGGVGDSIQSVDANATENPVTDAAAAAPEFVAEPEAAPVRADGEFEVLPVRSGNAPAEPPGRRIAAMAPELRGTELASIAADKTLPNVEPRVAANDDGRAVPVATASAATAGNSPRPLVDAGALIAAVANRPATNSAVGAAAGAQTETAGPIPAGAAIVPTASGAEGQFDPAGDHAGLHLGFGSAGMAGAASGAHAAAGPAQQTFSLRTPVEQVALQVVRAAGQQIDHLRLTLEPAELGRVDVRLELGPDNRLSLVVAADRPETLDLLQRDARVLERALQDAGLKTDSDSLSFNLRGEGRNDRDGTRMPASAPAAIEPDSIEAELPPAQAAQAYRPAAPGSLDIRI